MIGEGVATWFQLDSPAGQMVAKRMGQVGRGARLLLNLV